MGQFGNEGSEECVRKWIGWKGVKKLRSGPKVYNCLGIYSKEIRGRLVLVLVPPPVS